jgi:lipoyl(octanoyl) transferase
MVVLLVVVDIQASGARRAPVIRPKCGAPPTKLSSVEARRSAQSFIIAAERLPWRLLLSPPLGGPENMALDEALMARARRTGDTVLRVYEWSRPTLSLGRNQRAVGLYREAMLAERGIGVVRRPTGGRALLHHREITYSVTAPCDDSGALLSEYGRINALLRSALQSLGVPVVVAEPAGRAAAPSASPCFAEPARGELTLHGRKLVGSAQWRERGAMLQHGSILVDDDQSSIPGLLREPVAPPPRPATLRDALGREPVITELSDALFHAVRSLADPDAAPLEIDDDLTRDATAIAERYRDDAWTWRR